MTDPPAKGVLIARRTLGSQGKDVYLTVGRGELRVLESDPTQEMTLIRVGLDRLVRVPNKLPEKAKTNSRFRLLVLLVAGAKVFPE